MKAKASIGVSWGSYHIGCISAEAQELLCPPLGFLVSRKHPTWVMRGQTQTVTQGSTSIQQTGGASVPVDAMVSPAVVWLLGWPFPAWSADDPFPQLRGPLPGVAPSFQGLTDRTLASACPGMLRSGER